MGKRGWRGVLLLGATGFTLAGCAEGGVPPEAGAEEGAPVRASVEAASEALSRVEADLLALEGRTVRFEVTSTGAFHASLQGHLVLGSGNELFMEATGTFGSDPVSLRVRGTGDRMTWGNADVSEEAALPPALREAVIVGLVRMGVLHNLARLVSGVPPERADGTVRAWVETEDATWVEARAEDGARGIHFGIRVGGERAADATAWLDDEGRLIGRDQVVRFPGGEMHVVERYGFRE